MVMTLGVLPAFQILPRTQLPAANHGLSPRSNRTRGLRLLSSAYTLGRPAVRFVSVRSLFLGRPYLFVARLWRVHVLVQLAACTMTPHHPTAFLVPDAHVCTLVTPPVPRSRASFRPTPHLPRYGRPFVGVGRALLRTPVICSAHPGDAGRNADQPSSAEVIKRLQEDIKRLQEELNKVTMKKAPKDHQV